MKADETAHTSPEFSRTYVLRVTCWLVPVLISSAVDEFVTTLLVRRSRASLMSSRYLIALLGAAALVFACGPRGPHAAESAEAQEQSQPPRRHKRHAGEPVVSPAFDVRVSDGVDLALRLVNTTDKKVDLIFPTGRTHDFVVLDSAGREVWRWSQSRMFTGALQNRTIGAGESIEFAERWERPAEARGRFTAVAVLASENYPLERRVEFTLP